MPVIPKSQDEETIFYWLEEGILTSNRKHKNLHHLYLNVTGVCDTPLRKLKKNASKYVSTHLIKKYIEPSEG